MKRVVSIIFISTITFLGCVTFVNGLKGVSFTTLQYPKISHNKQTVMVDTLWSPSAEVLGGTELGQSEPHKRTFFERVRLLINHLNVHTKEWAAFGMYFVEHYGVVQKVMERQLIETNLGGVALIDNEQLAFVDNINEYGTEKWVKNRDLSWRNEAIEDLHSFIEDKTNSDFHFIITPYKIALEAGCPYGLFENYSNRKDFVERLKKVKFPVLDMNESLPKERGNAFYNTDHHYKIEYAFYQMPLIANFLNMSDSIYVPSNWTLINTGKEFKGSLSVQIGDKYSNLKDTLYYYAPNFPTHIKADYYSNNCITRRIGDFRQTVLFEEYLASVEKSRYTNLYMICSLGTTTMQKIYNEEACSNQKVLIFADSFGAPIISYLSVLFKEIDVIDLRSYKKRDIKKLICKESYDKIVCIYNTATNDMFIFD